MTSAFAQSTVGIKGTFDPSYTNQKTTYGDGAVRSVSGLFNSQQGTSQVTFFGTEDIGGGLTANFLLENDFNSTNDAKANWGSSTNTNIGQAASLGGETYVGLSGSMGEIKLGAPNSPSLDVTGRSPFGTKVGSGFGTAQGLSHVRENNQIVYATPTFNGLTLKVASASKTETLLAANGTAATAANAKQDVGLTYVNGPLKAVVASYKQAAVHKQTHGYVAYTMGNLTATYGFGSDERLAAVANVASTTAARAAGKSSNSSVAVAYAMGATTLMANVGKLNDKTTDNYDIKISSVGAKYDLSKRTSVYARYAKQTYANATDALIAKEQKTTLVGLAHNF